jgi:phospholipid/cholesterol/gamma-HCH transport system substrate-binding protein
VLQSITDLAHAIDPDAVSKLVTAGAEAIDGRGTTFNNALEQVSNLTTTLADQDEQLLEAARSINVIATALNSRSDQFGHLVDSLSEASGVLAAERDDIGRFLRSVVTLTDAGGSLLDAYGGTLPGDVAVVGDLALVLQNNLGSLLDTVHDFPTISKELIDAYDPARGGLVLNVSLSPLASIALRPLFNLLGLPVPCVPVLGDIQCP